VSKTARKRSLQPEKTPELSKEKQRLASGWLSSFSKWAFQTDGMQQEGRNIGNSASAFILLPKIQSK
jgi:hypothetical protein